MPGAPERPGKSKFGLLPRISPRRSSSPPSASSGEPGPASGLVVTERVVLPVIEPFAVSAAVSVAVPVRVNVTPLVKGCTPLSAAVKT